MAASTVLSPATPARLQLEVTAACNLRCRMCIVRYRPPFPRSASVSFTEFERLVAGMPGLREVVLQGIGEPLLAPDLYRMVAWCAEHGIDVGFNSNATLLTRRAGERLIDAGLSWLCISLDGASAETYEFVRDGARWQTVERNVSQFVALKRRRGVEHPRLSLVMVLMRRNYRELPGVVARAAGWGIPRVWVQNLSHDFSDAPPEAFAAIAQYVNEQRVEDLPLEALEPVFAEARALAEQAGIDLRLPHLEERPSRASALNVGGVPVACTWPWDSAYVSHDGTVMPCCMVMGPGRVALGNANAGSFAEIWEGEEFRRFREGLTNGRPHPVCRGCSMYHGTF